MVWEPLFHKNSSKYEQKEVQAIKAQGIQGPRENEFNKPLSFTKSYILWWPQNISPGSSSIQEIFGDK